MKVKLKNISKFLNENQTSTVKEFIQFLDNELPLNEDIEIFFEGGRRLKMTTGVRNPGNKIHVLTENRLLIDVMRTISHEWVHEFQHQKMGLKDTDKIQDIGGPEENMANVLSGIFLKSFIKKFPQHEKIMYNEK